MERKLGLQNILEFGLGITKLFLTNPVRSSPTYKHASKPYLIQCVTRKSVTNPHHVQDWTFGV
jgi:hypothetical protein